MSTSAVAISADEFQALEEKVLRAVEVLRRERSARASAEAEVERLRGELDRQRESAEHLQTGLTAMQSEREQVRRRVEKMLEQMDELL